MDSSLQLSGLSLFSGVGMLDEAVRLAFARRGVEYRTAVSCEWESGAASTLLSRMEEQSVEPHPVWCGDLRDFPAETFAGRIDVLTAGYPCQPFSVAGKQRGLSDERAMGEDEDGPNEQMLRIIGAVKPRFVFLENVPESLKHFRGIGSSLERLGYQIAPPVFVAAEDVGASHKRERVFTLCELEDSARYGSEQRPGWERTGAAVQELADSSESGRKGSECRKALGERNREEASGPTAEFREFRIFAPGPGERCKWERTLTDFPHLALAVEPEIRLLVYGVAYVVDSSRADQLRCTGNGVVALAGAAAFEINLRALGF